MTPTLTSAPTSLASLWLSFSPSSHWLVSTRRDVYCAYVRGTTTCGRSAAICAANAVALAPSRT